MTEQFWLPTPLLASKKWWDTVPKDLQAQIKEAAQESEKYFVQIYTADENSHWLGQGERGSNRNRRGQSSFRKAYSAGL